MQVNGVAFPDRAEQIFIVVNLQVGVHPSLHQDSRSSQFKGLFDLLEDRLQRKDVSPFRSRFPIEIAEGAAGHADVGVADIAIDQERDDPIRTFLATHVVSRLSHFLKLPGLQKGQSFLRSDPLALIGLLEDLLDYLHRSYSKEYSPKITTNGTESGFDTFGALEGHQDNRVG